MKSSKERVVYFESFYKKNLTLQFQSKTFSQEGFEWLKGIGKSRQVGCAVVSLPYRQPFSAAQYMVNTCSIPALELTGTLQVD